MSDDLLQSQAFVNEQDVDAQNKALVAQYFPDAVAKVEQEKQVKRAEHKDKFEAAFVKDFPELATPEQLWRQGQKAASVGKSVSNAAKSVGSTAIEAVGGVGVGFSKFIKNVYNGVAFLAGADEDAKLKTGDPNRSILGVNLKEIDQLDKNGTMASKAAQVATEFAIPMLGSAAVGGGLAAGAAFDAAYGMLTTDPDTDNLSAMVKDTWFGELPIASDIIGAMATKKDDSEFTRRMKVTLEGTGIGAMVWAAANVRTAYRQLKGLVKSEGKAAAHGVESSQVIKPGEKPPVGESGGVHAPGSDAPKLTESTQEIGRAHV